VAAADNHGMRHRLLHTHGNPYLLVCLAPMVAALGTLVHYVVVV
jgi:hypothetical protein